MDFNPRKVENAINSLNTKVNTLTSDTIRVINHIVEFRWPHSRTLDHFMRVQFCNGYLIQLPLSYTLYKSERNNFPHVVRVSVAQVIDA